MEWVLIPWKLWNLVVAFAYIVVPVVFFVVMVAWAYIHPSSWERFNDAFTRWAESRRGRRY